MNAWKAAAACVLLVCCAKQEEQPASEAQPALPALTAAQIQRGEQACADYADKLCACAETQPGLAKACALAKALPGALDMQRTAAQAEGDVRDLGHAQAAFNETVQTCFEGLAELARGCPEPEAAQP